MAGQQAFETRRLPAFNHLKLAQRGIALEQIFTHLVLHSLARYEFTLSVGRTS